MTHQIECLTYEDPSKPQGPSNVMAYCPGILNVVDIRWDDPNLLSRNIDSEFVLVGVNIYRSQTESGPYTKINSVPVTALSFRDTFQPELVAGEDVSGSFMSKGLNPNGDWFFCVSNGPIVDPTKNGVYSSNPNHVVLEIDDVVVPVRKVVGVSGEVYLHSKPYVDLACLGKEKLPPLPSPTSSVKISYYRQSSYTSKTLNQHIFYKVTSIDEDGNETPLANAPATTHMNVEQMDYIWKQAITRNRWILDQGGERVNAFVRKTMGERCTVCFADPEVYKTHQQARRDCRNCYGTGFVGGYLGPIPIVIAPKQGERAIELGPEGLHMNFVWSTWTTNFPLLRQRDFIRSKTGDIYVLGPVDPIEHRGLILQQAFSVSHIDSTDILYSFPIDGTVPLITEHPSIDDAIELRGNTITFKNITY